MWKGSNGKLTNKNQYEMPSTRPHWTERIFNSLSENARKDIKTFIIVMLVCSNAYFIAKWTSCTETRVLDKQEQYEELIRIAMPEIENRIERKVEEKTAPVGAKVDKAVESLGELTETIKSQIK